MARDLKRTALFLWHKDHGGQMVEFAGWEMPVCYKRGILEEHLSTRRYGGLFDISHMGRFLIQGEDAIPFVQEVLTNNAKALDPGVAQYTFVQNEKGGAIDDAYLYRLEEGNPSRTSAELSAILTNAQKNNAEAMKFLASYGVSVERVEP